MATEKRLIAFDPITFESFTRHATKHREAYDHYDMGYVDAVEQIENWMDANTVDAVEVVHGHWNEDHWEYVCSCCQKHFTDELPWISHPEYGMPNYCPNCGADMRGSEE